MPPNPPSSAASVIAKRKTGHVKDDDDAPKPYVASPVSSYPNTPFTVVRITQRPQSFFALDEGLASYIFWAANTLAALYAPIQDCDEVFNYWEPTHYLNHHHGMQTWEYSPEFAIRSWFYAGVHALVLYVASWLPMLSSKVTQFYVLRLLFAFVCAQCETRLYSTISRTMNPRIALFFLITLATGAGMFHASISYLPSSFAMYTVFLALADFMDWRGGIKTPSALTWLSIGAVVGWPFVGAIAFPFIFEEVVMAWVSGDILDPWQRLFNGLVKFIGVMGSTAAIDTFFTRTFYVAAFNLVWYNIFGGEGKGPDIYGTEPWHFYIRNLLINFNFWFILACLSFPLLIFQHRIRGQNSSRLSYFRTLIFISPFYLWLGIFTLQPHKEERFMYPIYPCLALNAALSLHIIILTVSESDPQTLFGKIPPRVKMFFISTLLLLSIELGITRSIGLGTGYSAPLNIYQPLHAPGMTRPGNTICLGKEWYRFPSSYLLPLGTRLKFIKSEFHGLLPGEFSEAFGNFGFFPGAWLIPSGMNDENIEDPSKYTDVEHCTYLVDSYFPGAEISSLEPDRVHDTEKWEQVKCLPFLDTARTAIIPRLFWLPPSPLIPVKYRRQWGEYCLLKRK